MIHKITFNTDFTLFNINRNFSLMTAPHRSILYVLLPLILYSSLISAEDYFANKKIQLIESQQTPLIDGIFNEEEWQDATVINNLIERDPVIGRTPEFKTKIYVKYDSKYLYFAAIMEQNADTIAANQLVQGQRTWHDDFFGVFIDPSNQKNDSYYFHVNPNSIREDALIENRQYIGEWSSIWQARAQVNDDNWVVEMAIPVQSLSFNQDISDWGLQFRRKLHNPRREYYWNLNNEGWGWYTSQSGTMQGINGLDTGIGLEVKPSLSLKNQAFTTQDNEVKAFQPSLDIFYKITPSLTTALTLNTDFSGTDVDQQQVNLSRFSLFLSEKRDFFLQDAGIFEFGGLSSNGRPFFSRKIGLSSTGTALDIDAGIKLTGKIDKFNLGLLAVQQDAENLNDGSSYVSVLRTRYNINENGYIGGIITSGNPEIDQPDKLFGVDMRQSFSLSDGNKIEGSFWWQKVDNHNGPGTNNNAYGGNITLPNDKFLAEIDYAVIEENFKPALGFVNRKNIKKLATHFVYRNRLNNDYFTSIQSRLNYDHTTDINGRKLSHFLLFRPMELNFVNNSHGNLGYKKFFERIDNSFTLVNKVDIPVGDYHFNRYGFYYRTDHSRPYSAYAYLETGDYFHGKRDDLNIGLWFNPNKHVAINSEYRIKKMRFAQDKFDTKTIRLNINLAINAFWAWTTKIQYDNVSDSAGLFSRIKFEPKAGEVYQLVLSRSFEVDDEFSRFKTQQQQLLIKGAYTYRF